MCVNRASPAHHPDSDPHLLSTHQRSCLVALMQRRRCGFGHCHLFQAADHLIGLDIHV